MLPHTFSLRRSAIAYLFPVQPGMRREDNLRFYDRVGEQGIEVPQLFQETTALRLARETKGTPATVFEIQVDHHQGNFRLLVAETWPTKPLDVFVEAADITWDCFQEVWPVNRLGGRPVLIETNLRATAAADGGDATAFLKDRCMRISHEALAKLGRQIQGVGLRIVLPVQVSIGDQKIPLDGADGNMRIETLLDDPSRLYFEMTTKWPSVPIPQEVRERAPGVPEQLNPEILQPSEYVRRSYDYLTLKVGEFLVHSG